MAASRLVVIAWLLLPTVFSFYPSTARKMPAKPLYSAPAKEKTSVSPYSPAELQEALDSLWKDSSNPDFDARHIYGYKDPNHELSMLQIIQATRILDYRNEPRSVEELQKDLDAFQAQYGAPLNLQTVIQSTSPRMALAAEFKRASPSKGPIAVDLKAGEQARLYGQAGANIISVLTEPRWFLGSLEDMKEARLQTDRPAILRKDFVFDESMILEAAANGADTVLLIVAVLPQHVLERLIQYCRSLGMEPLVEVHADAELDVALQAGAKVIGVNNRNLHTFQVDMATSERTAQELTKRGLVFHHDRPDEAEYTLCALSGMSNAMDVDRYRQVGLGMCLIGESLMRAVDPSLAIQGLCLHPDDFAKTQGGSSGGAYTGGTQIVKVCGVTNAEDALVACRAGANLIGVIFAEKSARKVSAQQAEDVVKAVRDFGERSASPDWKWPVFDDPMQQLVACSRMLTETTRRPLVVGVFQNQEPEFIREMVQTCGLDLVQLHGKEGFAAANRETCGAPAIRVVDILVDPDTGKASEKAVDTLVDSLTTDPVAILLDTAIKGQTTGGGTSRTFDWKLAQRVQESGLPVLIAGGLTVENVKDAVSSTRPFGIDVSSGVEATPGLKDHDKVMSFVRDAKAAAVEASKGF